MAHVRSAAAQELMAAFSRFKRLNWHQRPGAILRPREVMVLSLVEKKTTPGGPGITISELSEAAGVTSPTTTQLINGLEADGYVDRTTDPCDRRAVRITLTPKGAATLKTELAAFFSAFDGLTEYLGEEDSLTLARLLSRVFEYFNQAR